MRREVMQELIDKRREQRADIFKINRQSEIEFTINGHKYELINQYRDGFQVEPLEERFSTVLSKYDYIVGDWGFDQLRLKGFYAPKSSLATKTTVVDTIQDYLYEYCNFGCAYFVIHNLDVQLPKPEKTEPRVTHRNKTTKPSKRSGHVKAQPTEKHGANSKATKRKPTGQRSHESTKQQQRRHQSNNQQHYHDNELNKGNKTKPHIRERQSGVKPPVQKRANQEVSRVKGNHTSKQKFVIRHK